MYIYMLMTIEHFGLFQAVDEALAQIQMCSKLEELLLKKKYFSYGDSPELHAEKVLHTDFLKF